jgi:signal transduction histidine kinase
MALDEFSFSTEGLTAWLASNCQDKSQLLQGKALEDAKQLVGCRSLSEPDYQFLIASQELEKQELLKQLELARQQTQDVKQEIAGFLASARTQIATPLNGIICSLKLIIDGDGFIDDAPELEREELKRELIDEAHRDALETLGVVNDLVAIANLFWLETNKFYLELEPIKLAYLLTEIENSLQNQAHEKELNFQFNGFAAQAEIIAYGNYSKLRQVMLRLVGDAIKYTDEGRITIVVEMIEQKIVLKNQEHPGLVKIHIANDKYKYGQNSLLRFFQKMNYSSIYEWYCTPAFGLAMSKTLIEAMSGEFHFEVIGQGDSTTVTISLPLYQETVMT